MAKPKQADPAVWGAVCALGVAVLSLVFSLVGYVPKEAGAGAGGAFFLGMLAAWARNLSVR